MELFLADDYLNLKVVKSKIYKFFSLMEELDFYNGLYYPKSSSIHTFFNKNEIDIIGINEKDCVIFKYQDVPKNKIIEIKNNKKNTSILVLPKNTSKVIKIGDILTLVDEDII